MRPRGFFRLGPAAKLIPFGGAMVDRGGVATISFGGRALERMAASADKFKVPD